MSSVYGQGANGRGEYGVAEGPDDPGVCDTHLTMVMPSGTQMWPCQLVPGHGEHHRYRTRGQAKSQDGQLLTAASQVTIQWTS